LIEAVTFRRGAHTTSDDPTLYRTPDEETAWEKKDPVRRLRLYLQGRKLWDEAGEAGLVAGYKKEIDARFLEAENYPPYPLADVFRFMYRRPPEILKRQQAEYEKFLDWKERRK
jgi:pyruvate dehydrogenase E1 component alpha subunit